MNFEKINKLAENEVVSRIEAARKELGARLLILGHHYQHDSVIRFADMIGDSFLLAREAARCEDAEYIVFLGVNFMAETADIVTSSGQKVIIPDLEAGCDLACMAEMRQVEQCWSKIQAYYPGEIIPVTYVNSSADLKAFCGKNGGLTCTSSSSLAAFNWVLEQGKRVMFFPDENLGRNTGVKLGIKEEDMAVWNRQKDNLEGSSNPRVILWDGYCPVHQEFVPGLVDMVREDEPGVKVIVHPECPRETVKKVDGSGSTEYIIKSVDESPPGSAWAIGTDLNLVKRLKNDNPDKKVFSLDWEIEPCRDMMKINNRNLLWCLENLLEGRIVNRVKIDPGVAEMAKAALERMLYIG